MAKLNVRNRNAGKVDKDGKPKAPNWEYRYEIARTENGKKRNQISKSGFRTKKEALEAGTKSLAEYQNSGLSFSPTEISVEDFLSYWLNNYCKMNIADSTMAAYKNIIKNHINPRIGFYKLKSVNTLVLQEMINDIYVTQGFTKSFMKNILKVLKGSFKYAKVTAKLIKDNPAEDVTLPNMSPDSEAEEIIILTKENVNRILERFKSQPATYYGMLTAYYAGMRVGEVYGLTWDRIDFEKKQIRVDRAIKKIEKDGKVSDSGKRRRLARGKSQTRWYLGECKTKTSYRTIDIGDSLINALKEYKAWQEKNKEEYGNLYTNHYMKDETTETNRKVKRIIPLTDMDFEIPMEKVDFVFVKENGEFRGSDTPKYASKVINYELGIHYNFHAFRHTHATMLIEAGVPVKAVSERLGHGNVRTTMETYVHVTDTMRNNAVDKFETVGNLNETNIVNFADKKRKVDTVAK